MEVILRGVRTKIAPLWPEEMRNVLISELKLWGWSLMKKQHWLGTSFSRNGDVLVILWERNQFVYHRNQDSECQYYATADFLSDNLFNESTLPS